MSSRPYCISLWWMDGLTASNRQRLSSTYRIATSIAAIGSRIAILRRTSAGKSLILKGADPARSPCGAAGHSGRSPALPAPADFNNTGSGGVSFGVGRGQVLLAFYENDSIAGSREAAYTRPGVCMRITTCR